jgi:hypothetical protein
MMRFQGLPNGTNATVHHVAGCNDIGTRACLSQRLFNEYFDGGVVHDVARFRGARVRQTILPVAGKRVQRHITHNAEFRKFLFERLHHPWHQTIGVQCLPAIRCFERRVNHGEKGHHRYAKADALFSHWQQVVKTQALHAWHG